MARVRSLGTIANREESIRKFIKRLGSPEQLRACYEADRQDSYCTGSWFDVNSERDRA
jgi:hypothetical protein